MNFRLSEHTERMNPETLFAVYSLTGYDDSIKNPIVTFTYDSYGGKPYKIDENGKQRKCKKEKMSKALHHCLQSAPSNNLYDENEVNQIFTAIMRKADVHGDPRFGAKLNEHLLMVCCGYCSVRILL